MKKSSIFLFIVLTIFFAVIVISNYLFSGRHAHNQTDVEGLKVQLDLNKKVIDSLSPYMDTLNDEFSHYITIVDTSIAIGFSEDHASMSFTCKDNQIDSLRLHIYNYSGNHVYPQILTFNINDSLFNCMPLHSNIEDNYEWVSIQKQYQKELFIALTNASRAKVKLMGNGTSYVHDFTKHELDAIKRVSMYHLALSSTFYIQNYLLPTNVKQ